MSGNSNPLELGELPSTLSETSTLEYKVNPKENPMDRVTLSLEKLKEHLILSGRFGYHKHIFNILGIYVEFVLNTPPF